MADEKNQSKKGFSGLSDLVSEVDFIDEPHKQTHTIEASPLPSSHPTSRQQKDVPLNSQAPGGGSIRPVEAALPGNKGSGSAGKWILAGIGACLGLWLVLNGGQSNKMYSPSAQKPQSYSAPQSSPAPAGTLTSPRVTQSSGLQYTRPSIGTGNLLSVPEIRWCIRNGIRIDAMRNLIETNAGIDEFNRIVNDHNSRCGNYRYRQGDQEQAKRSVEPYRSQIVAEAVREARQLGRPYQPSASSVSPAPTTSRTRVKPAGISAPEKPNVHYTREAQQLLTELGYKPGPVDGDYGRRTSDAVRAFQRDKGITQDGQIDEEVLMALRRAKAEYKPSIASQPQPPTQPNSQHHSH